MKERKLHLAPIQKLQLSKGSGCAAQPGDAGLVWAPAAQPGDADLAGPAEAVVVVATLAGAAPRPPRLWWWFGLPFL